MMRLSNYLKSEFIKAGEKAFGECSMILFGSRVDDSKRGGDFDISINADMTPHEFKKAKAVFMKHLLLKDLDLPVDLVLYGSANDLLKSEIDKGVKI